MLPKVDTIGRQEDLKAKCKGKIRICSKCYNGHFSAHITSKDLGNMRGNGGTEDSIQAKPTQQTRQDIAAVRLAVCHQNSAGPSAFSASRPYAFSPLQMRPTCMQLPWINLCLCFVVTI